MLEQPNASFFYSEDGGNHETAKNLQDYTSFAKDHNLNNCLGKNLVWINVSALFPVTIKEVSFRMSHGALAGTNRFNSVNSCCSTVKRQKEESSKHSINFSQAQRSLV